VERDHLQEQWSGKSPSDGAFGAGNPIIGSIEYDPEWGDALAYWLLTRHPGDAYSLVTIPVDEKNFRVQVPADQVILFDNPRTRANQATGNTELDATILPLWRIHQYDKSLTLSSIASASKPWWVEEDNPTGLELPGEIQKLVDAYKVNVPNGILSESPGQDQVATQASGGPKKNVVRPASREEFPAGKRLKQADPKFPIEAAHTFRQDNERDLATGTHGSYQQMSGDYQNLGFVAGLMSQIPFQRNIKVRQKTMAEDLRPMFRAWLKSTILKGYFEKRGVFVSITRVEEIVEAAYFKGQQADFVNPLLQMQTLILGNEVGAITDQQFQDALPNGRPIEEIYTQRKYEQEMKLKLGLMAPSVVATMPNINKEGEAAPGQEKPAESVAGGEGPATPPPKTTVQTPHPGRKRGEIDANTRMLLEMSQNGH
jgi:capsid protein